MVEINVGERTFGFRYLIFVLVGLVLIAGVIYGIYNYQKNNSAQKEPTVQIYKPNDNQEFTEAQIILEGKTDPKSKVKVGDKDVTVDKQGNFATEVVLNEGSNIIPISITGQNGKNITVERKVSRMTPQPIVTEESVPQASYNGNLNNSGPENFWLPETSLLAAAGTFFLAAKNRIKKATKKV